MTLRNLLTGCGLTVPFGVNPDISVAGLTCDSRRVEPGYVFVCIRGTAADGHDFASDALQAGALLLVAERDLGLSNQLLVPAPRKTWALLCAHWFGYPLDRIRLIGITGTNGKTTTTYMLKSILEEAGYKVGLIGTLQNMIGARALPTSDTTPYAYDLQSLLALMVTDCCAFCVMEVSSQALDQSRVEGCLFEAAVFTNLTQDHLDYHGTMENYLLAKKQLFLQCKTAILNLDDDYYAALSEGLPCPVVTYSTRRDTAAYTAHNVRPRPDGVDFELVGTGVIGRVKLAIPGLFSVYNALAAATCALTLGLDFSGVVDALCRVTGVKGRAEVVPTGRPFTVVIDYAHSPDSLRNILETLKAGAAGRLVCLFGCGGDRDHGKRPLMAAVAAQYADFLVITSDNPRAEDPMAIIADITAGLPPRAPHTVIENRREAIRWALQNSRDGDIILLAGKGHETYQLVGHDVLHLDEREVVAEALAEMKQ